MDVYAEIRGVLHERRVEHVGTLDPVATGVLPVSVGRATRAVEFASEPEKEYIYFLYAPPSPRDVGPKNS